MSKKNNIDKVVLLYDSYKELLTKKQRDLFEEYYFDDLSFKEISEKKKISRAAIHDSIHKTVDALKKLEKKLGLTKTISKIDDIKNELKKSKPSIKEIKEIIK